MCAHGMGGQTIECGSCHFDVDDPQSGANGNQMNFDQPNFTPNLNIVDVK